MKYHSIIYKFVQPDISEKVFTLYSFSIMMYGKSKKRTQCLERAFYFLLLTSHFLLLTLPHPTSTFLFISFMAGIKAMLKVTIK